MNTPYELKQQLLVDRAKQIKEDWFKNHTATLFKGPANVIEWKNPKSSIYSLYITMYRNTIAFTGDLGSAVFDLTWTPTPLILPPTELNYVLGKLSCFAGNDLWDGRVAQAYLDCYLRDGTLTEDQHYVLYDVAQYDKFEYEQTLIAMYHDNKSNIDCETVSSLMKIGEVIHPRKQVYHIGWTMAVEEIIKKESHDISNDIK